MDQSFMQNNFNLKIHFPNDGCILGYDSFSEGLVVDECNIKQWRNSISKRVD